MNDNTNELRIKIDDFIKKDKEAQCKDILELIVIISDEITRDELYEYLFKNIQGNVSFIMEYLLNNETIEQSDRAYSLYLMYAYMDNKEQNIEYLGKYLKKELNGREIEYIEEYTLFYLEDIFQNCISPDFRKKFLEQFINELPDDNIESLDNFATELNKGNLKAFIDILGEYMQNAQESEKTKKLGYSYNMWRKQYYKKNRDIGPKPLEELLVESENLSKEGKISEIIKSDSMDYLWQLYYADELLEEHKKRFEQIIDELQKNGNKVTEEDMEPYIEKVNNAKEMNLDEFRGFIRNIAKMRITNGIIDEQYCDYILEQKVITRTELSKRCPRYILRRAFEDKARHILKEKSIKGYLIKMEDMEERYSGVHCYNNREIRYNNNIIHRFGSRSINVMNHEIRHADKAQQIIEEHNITTFVDYMIMKEEILKKYRHGYYEDNYIDMYGEIDARIAGDEAEWKFIQRVDSLDPREDYIMKRDEAIYNKRLNKERERIKNGTVKDDGLLRVSFTPVRYLDKRLEDILKENPEIIEEYPELLIEFNNDGSKKRISIILEEYENLSKKTQVQKDIYENIFGIENYLNDEEIALDIKNLIEYKAKSDEGEKLRKSIFINIVLPNIERVKKERIKENLFGEDGSKYNEIYGEIIRVIREIRPDDLEEEIKEMLIRAIEDEQDRTIEDEVR